MSGNAVLGLSLAGPDPKRLSLKHSFRIATTMRAPESGRGQSQHSRSPRRLQRIKQEKFAVDAIEARRSILARENYIRKQTKYADTACSLSVP